MVLPDSAGNRFELPVIGHQSAGVVRVGDRFGGIRVDRFRFISPQQLLQLFVVVPVGAGRQAIAFLLFVVQLPLAQRLEERLLPDVVQRAAVGINVVDVNRRVGHEDAWTVGAVPIDVEVIAVAVAAGFLGVVSIRANDIPMFLVCAVITFIIAFAAAQTPDNALPLRPGIAPSPVSIGYIAGG